MEGSVQATSLTPLQADVSISNRRARCNRDHFIFRTAAAAGKYPMHGEAGQPPYNASVGEFGLYAL